jgi:RNA polymerase sigma factor (sigma-70 family)
MIHTRTRMPTNPMSEIIHHLRRTLLLRDGMDLTDGQLLESFVRRGEQAGLEALVRRHGPMVWGVCRRILRNHHDAEDAFQATFLVLFRKATSIVPREMVGNWLYGVAQKTALKARAATAKRRTKERQEAEMPEPAATEKDLWMDLQPLLDHELGLLPDKYRVVIVLCDLEGKTRREAAGQLGCPEGTVGSRLARARTMLIKRLAARGLAVSGSTLAAVLSEQLASACVPTSVMTTTINAVSKIKSMTAAGVLTLGIVAFGSGFYMHQTAKPVAAQNTPAQTANIGDGQGAQPAVGDPTQKDLKQLQGKWEVVAAVYNGEKHANKDPIVWTITRSHFVSGSDTQDAYKLNAATKPKQIDITVFPPKVAGNVDRAVLLGIYELKGDPLRICLGYTEKDRPKDFESGVGRNLFTLKRLKSE